LEYSGKYDKKDMVLPIGSQEDDEFIPLVFKDLTEEERRGIISSYYTSVEYLDKNIGIVLKAIEETGLINNTLVVYLGDHGYLLNDHKRFEKHMMWEEAVKAPLILRAGSYHVENTIRSELVEFVDVVPTIIDFLGVGPLSELHGNSLRPFFKKEDFVIKDAVFSEFLADNKAMVRTRKWKYIFTSGKRDLAQGYATGKPPSGIKHRLYNLEADPKETMDISNHLVNRKILEELQIKMIAIFEETHPFAKYIPSGLSTEEQLAWYCEPPDDNPDIDAK
jgi:arylsulfatase A-like enzyme